MPKKRAIKITAVAVALLLTAAVAAIGIIRTASKTVYAVIDGKRVYEDEITLYIREQRTAAVSHFINEYQLDGIDKDFWSREYGDTTPCEYLAGLALESLRKDHALFSDCEKIDGADKITFSSIKKEMKNENEKRALSLQNGVPVYGVTQYSLSSWLDYYKSNLTVKHREYLKEKGMLSPDELQLKGYYNELIKTDASFKNEDGSVKTYADMRSKVSYLCTENEYNTYIKELTEKQKIKIYEKTLKMLVSDLENREGTA